MGCAGSGNGGKMIRVAEQFGWVIQERLWRHAGRPARVGGNNFRGDGEIRYGQDFQIDVVFGGAGHGGIAGGLQCGCAAIGGE